MGNSAHFGIGTYQPITGGVSVGGGFAALSNVVVNPLAGIYGGTYGYVLDTTIRAPTQISYTPAPEIGIDGIGVPIVRGYPSFVWTYNLLAPQYWYQLIAIWKQSARVPPGFEYLVLLQYPDTITSSGTLIRTLARMEPPVCSNGRTVSVFEGVQLTFRYLGQSQLIRNTPITVLS
jgi:hypothetical protein